MASRLFQVTPNSARQLRSNSSNKLVSPGILAICVKLSVTLYIYVAILMVVWLDVDGDLGANKEYDIIRFRKKSK